MKLVGTIVLIVILVVIGMAIMAPVIIFQYVSSINSAGMGDPDYRFGYRIGVAVSFSVDGRQFKKVAAVHCGVWVDHTRTSALLEKGEVNFDFVLPDGSALAMYDLRLCPPGQEEPKPDTPDVDYSLARNDGEPVEAGRLVARGTAAWFASATRQDEVFFYDLAELAAGDGPRLMDFRLARSGSVPTTGDFVSSVPVLADWDQPRGSLKAGTPGWDKWQAEGRLLSVSASVSEVSPNSSGDCAATMSELSGRSEWAILPAGTCYGANRVPVRLSLTDGMRQIRVFADGSKSASRIGFTRAALTEAGIEHWIAEPVPKRERRRLVHWDQDVCIEGQCFALTLDEGMDRWIVFYHPPTGRLVELSSNGMDMDEVALLKGRVHWR